MNYAQIQQVGTIAGYRSTSKDAEHNAIIPTYWLTSIDNHIRYYQIEIKL